MGEVETPRSVTLSAAVARASAAALPAAVRLSLHIWVHWAQIAIREEDSALRARQHMIETQAEAGGEYVDAFVRELHASMVAVAAAAHAIDAFYGTVKQHLPTATGVASRDDPDGLPRHAQIRKTLGSGFLLGNETGKRWEHELTWLFGLRDGVVHFREHPRPSALHPLGGQMAQEQVDYDAEAATRAVAVMLDIFDTCTRSPRPDQRDLAVRTAGLRVSASWLIERRQELAALRTAADPPVGSQG